MSTRHFKMYLYFFSAKSITKRTVNEIYFKPEDIYIPSDPKEVDGLVVVVFAVVKASGIPMVVSRNLLTRLIEKKADEIGRKLGGTIVVSKRKPSQIKDRPTSETRTKEQKKWLIIGVSSAGALIVIVAVIGICYFRLVTCWVLFLCVSFNSSFRQLAEFRI